MRINPIIMATNNCFLICKSSFLKPIAKLKIRSGATTLAVLNVYIDRTKEITERESNNKNLNPRVSIGFHPKGGNEATPWDFTEFTAVRNKNTPKTIKKVATFASKAARESMMCQGEIARISAEVNPYKFFRSDCQKILFVKK